MAKMNLDKLIKDSKYNQKDIADYTGINKNTISKYVNNTFEKIDKEHIDLLCDFFKCTPNDLFKLEPVQQKIFSPSEIGDWMTLNNSDNIQYSLDSSNDQLMDLSIRKEINSVNENMVKQKIEENIEEYFNEHFMGIVEKEVKKYIYDALLKAFNDKDDSDIVLKIKDDVILKDKHQKKSTKRLDK